MADPDERWPGERTTRPEPGLQTYPGGRGGMDPGPAVIIEDDRWRRLHGRPEALARRAAIAAGGAGTVVLSSDLAVKRLNADHRGRNKPTNVLTFDALRTPQGGFLGGDIILALETVRREANAAGRSALHHMAHLVVHGALHLRGFDHEQAGDARRMEMEETRILHRLGIANPWKGMAGAGAR